MSYAEDNTGHSLNMMALSVCVVLGKSEWSLIHVFCVHRPFILLVEAGSLTASICLPTYMSLSPYPYSTKATSQSSGLPSPLNRKPPTTMGPTKPPRGQLSKGGGFSVGLPAIRIRWTSFLGLPEDPSALFVLAPLYLPVRQIDRFRSYAAGGNHTHSFLQSLYALAVATSVPASPVCFSSQDGRAHWKYS